MIPKFVQLHNHTTHSKYDGYASPEELVLAAKKHGMEAVGLTDHGTFSGAVKFFMACKQHGIKPILGMESYLSRDHTVCCKEGQPDGRKGNKHINLYAKNYKGYQNLCTLSQIASLQGFYHDPRIDIELLDQYKEGLIVTSACLSNVINWNLSLGNYQKAKEAATLLKDVFGRDFKLEAMNHGIDEELKILPDIQKIGSQLDIDIHVTNDVHYIEKTDANMHEVIVCMSSKRTLKDPKRKRFPYSEFYFKSAAEMYKVFKHVPKYMQNTMKIVEEIDYSDLPFGGMKLPKFPKLPDGQTAFEFLSTLAWKGYKELGFDSEVHKARLERELSDIGLVLRTNQYPFDTYFLIIWDILREARERDIPYGVRGSACGSFLARCLRFFDSIDPIKFGLLWERFLGFDDIEILIDECFGIKAKVAA